MNEQPVGYVVSAHCCQYGRPWFVPKEGDQPLRAWTQALRFDDIRDAEYEVLKHPAEGDIWAILPHQNGNERLDHHPLSRDAVAALRRTT